jgi:hypothetical protein
MIQREIRAPPSEKLSPGLSEISHDKVSLDLAKKSVIHGHKSSLEVPVKLAEMEQRIFQTKLE